MPVAVPRPRRRGQVATFLYADDYAWQCDQYERDPSQILEHLWGGHVSLRRDDCLRVGLSGFAPRSRHADRDFGIRCKAAGLEGVFDRTLTASHLHERTMDQFLLEAHMHARGNWWLHQSHPELGTLGSHEFTEHLPRPAGWAVVAGRGRLQRPTVWGLRRVTEMAGLVHWWKLESVAAMAMSHTIQLRAVLEFGAPSPSGPGAGHPDIA